MVRLLLFTSVLLFTCQVGFAQIHQSDRIEFELQEKDEDFLLISAEEDGIFLSRKVKNNETRRDFKYQIVRLDTALNIHWQLHDYVDLEYQLVGYDYIGPYVYFLYNSTLKRRKYKAIRFHKDSQVKEVFDIEMNFEIELVEFEVIDETLIFGGYVNNRPSFICYKYNNASPVVLPGFSNEPHQIMQLEVEPEKGIFNILLSILTPEKKKSIAIKSYNTKGELLKDLTLQPQGDYGLLYGRSVVTNDDLYLVVGTYTQRKSDLSRGIFVSTIQPDASHVINYYNYADLKNFFNYMKARKEIRIKKKIERRKIKGKKNKFYYKLLVDEIIEMEDQFVMVGEAFYPKYNYGGSGTGAFSRTYSGAGYFEGYAYTHAVIIGFDKKGRILWDNSFEIQDVLTYNLRNYVSALPTGDGILLLYLFENSIRTKLIKGTKVLDVQENADLKNPYEHNKMNRETISYSNLDMWYGQNLFAYGIQEIDRIDESGVSASKEVFFINKISLK